MISQRYKKYKPYLCNIIVINMKDVFFEDEQSTDEILM